MRKLFLMVLAVGVLLTSACTKQEANGVVTDMQITVKIPNLKSSTKAVETPGVDATGTIQLVNGAVFVIGADKMILHSEAIVTANAATGHTIAGKFNSDVQILVVANVPATKITAWTTAGTIPGNTDVLLAEIFSIAEAEHGQKYAQATLANVGGTPAAVTVDAVDKNKATVNVTIKPVYSRLELAKITPATTHGTAITGFDIVGVYVTDYFPGYKYNGTEAGTQLVVGTDGKTEADVIAEMKNEGKWSGTGAGFAFDGSDAGKVFAFNTPSSATSTSRLIIKINNIQGTINGAPMAQGQTYYITVKRFKTTGATPAEITAFEPGKIYNIANIDFDASNLSTIPNATDVEITATVTITEWEIVPINAEL